MEFLEQAFTFNARDRADFAAAFTRADAEAVARFYVLALEDPTIKVSYRRISGATPRVTHSFAVKSPGLSAREREAVRRDARRSGRKVRGMLEEAEKVKREAERKAELAVEVSKLGGTFN